MPIQQLKKLLPNKFKHYVKHPIQLFFWRDPVTYQPRNLFENIYMSFLSPENLEKFEEEKKKQHIAEWEKAGRPYPPAHGAKSNLLRDIARQYGINVFIETGTYRGDMTWSLKNIFKKMYTVEIAPHYYKRAVKRFRKYPHILPLLGDSKVELPKVLNQLSEPALFWLDAHYSSHDTGFADEHSPIMSELKLIQNESLAHVILIDDAKYFVGKDGYPTIQYMEEATQKMFPGYTLKVDLDIIHLLPPALK